MSKNPINIQKLLEAAFEQTHIPVLITDAELDSPGPRIVFVNPAFEKMTGYAAAELVGQTPRILQGAKTDRAMMRRLRESLGRGDIFHGSTYNYRKDGTPYYLEWQVSPVADETGRASHYFAVQNDVTSRKIHEDISREAQEYKKLFNFVKDSIVVFDASARTILNVNDQACSNYDISRYLFVGLPLVKIFDAAAIDNEMIATLLRTGAVGEFETVHRRADGSIMNVVVNLSLVEYEGKPSVLAINRDVTDRYQALTAVKKAKEEWTKTVDSISDLIILADSDGRIMRCNQATAEFFARPYTELVGRSLDDLIRDPNSDLATLPDEIFSDKFKRAQTRGLWEEQLPGRNDWLEFSNHPVFFNHDNERGWVHIVKDITERKISEAALRLLDTAIEQAADGIVILDVEGFIEYVNPSFERITGYERVELLNCEFVEINNHAQLRKLALQKTSDEAVDKIQMLNGTNKAMRRNGEVYDQEITVSPVRDRSGTLLNYVLICRDITEKRRLESIAEAVNMMEGVGYVFSGIRHELGNPINSAKTALSVLRKNLDKWDKEQTVTYIDRSLKEIGRVEYLLRALKTFSAHENPKMQPIALPSFMQDFVALIEKDFEQRNIAVKIGKSKVGEVLCDPRALHQVMLNLVANAGDALENCDDAKIIINLTRNNRFVHISVKDNGAGMTELQQENLFKPFYTSKAHGTGLGLVIVKKMVAKMNGTIQIRSTHGVGTEVNFTLEAA